MGDKRKLQSEIDRTLKKIDEGLDVYDRIYQKVVDAESQSNKEKYEVRKPARCLTLESCPGRPRRGAVTSRDGPRLDAISGPAGRIDASPGAPRAAPATLARGMTRGRREQPRAADALALAALLCAAGLVLLLMILVS